MSPPFPAYIGNLTLITAGYALFQVANATVVIQGSGRDNRGVTAALLGRSRSLGLITGASAMAAFFAAGLHRDELMDMMTASEAGLLSALARRRSPRSRKLGLLGCPTQFMRIRSTKAFFSTSSTPS